MGLEHLDDSELFTYKTRGYTALADDALVRLKQPEGFGIPPNEDEKTTDEISFEKQHPVVAGIEKASKLGNYLGGKIGSVIEGIDKTNEQVKKDTKGLVNLYPGYTAAESIFKAGKAMRDTAIPLKNKGDELISRTYEGQSALSFKLQQRVGIEINRLGILLENSPIPASMGEAIVAGAFEAAPGIGRAIDQGIGKGFKKLPGVRPFRDHEARVKAVKSSLDASDTERINAENTRDSLAITLKNMEERLGPTQDSQEYGIQTKRYLEASTEASRAPLAGMSKGIQIATEGLGSSSLEPLAPSIEALRNDLLGVIKTTPDSPVVAIIDKYLGKVETPKDLGVKYNHKTNAFEARTPQEASFRSYPEASVGDLLKDRGRVGKAYVKSLQAGGRESVQSVVLKDLQRIIDTEVDARVAQLPEVSKDIHNLRNSWQDFYDTQYSQEANALRNVTPDGVVSEILKNTNTIDSARKVVPQALEQAIAVKKAQVMQELKGGKADIASILKGEQPGYYERLFSTSDRAQLIQFDKLSKQYPEAVGRLNKLVKDIQDSPTKGRRSTDTDKLFGHRRVEDSGKKQGFAELVQAAQGTRGAVPVEAVTMGYMVHWLSPLAAKVIIAAGVAPAAMAWAYYSASPALRARITTAVRTVAKEGVKSPGVDLQLLRKINRGEQITEDKGMSNLFNK